MRLYYELIVTVLDKHVLLVYSILEVSINRLAGINNIVYKSRAAIVMMIHADSALKLAFTS